MNNRERLGILEFFDKMNETERRQFLDFVVYREIPAGTVLVEENTCSFGVPFVLTGGFQAYKVSETGKEIALYSACPGETCVTTIAGLLGLRQNSSPVSVIASQDSLIAVLPADKFRQMYAISTAFQQYILTNVLQKFNDVIGLLERLTFKSVSERLREYLEESSGGGRWPVYATHAQLAARLGTSREVITRKLRDLEVEGVVKAQRGKILLMPLQPMQMRAAGR